MILDIQQALKPQQMDTPAARRFREDTESGFYAGRNDMPLPANSTQAFRDAWTAGDVQRRAAAGLVLATHCQGSKCLKCAVISMGLRASCRCWPTTFDARELGAEGYRMEWGMMVDKPETQSGDATEDIEAPVGPGSLRVKFMSRDELMNARDKGMEIVDRTTGKLLKILSL